MSKEFTITLPDIDAWVLIEAAYRGGDHFDDMYDDMMNDGVLDGMPEDEVAIARDAGKKIREIAHEVVRQVMEQRQREMSDEG